ncbi:methionyl-tRNA formyltransferase [candidate division WOR-3 bacterium]|nr:methionyl-tRNA formyltransferase [candidate division WOR-3 bacterium]
MQYKIILFGTSRVACPSIEILSQNHKLLAVVTSPNPSPVKEIAHSLGIKVLGPDNPNSIDFLNKLRGLNPDIICVAAYGHILSKELLEVPRLASINLHPSLLPKYRGGAPMRRAIINGEKKTGVTTFIMDEKLDHGDILLQKEVEIDESETFGELETKLSKIGAELLLETINKFNKLKPIPQSDSIATYAPKISKELRLIDWQKGATEIVNLIRALSPKPVAYTNFRGKRLEILSAKVAEPLPDGQQAGFRVRGQPGRIEKAKETLIIGTGSGCIEIKLLKPEAKSTQTALDFINGYHPKVGDFLK